MSLYKQHHADVLKRGIRNQALFEAYVQYFFAPKHTVGEQLPEVRRDKRDRAAYAAAVGETRRPAMKRRRKAMKTMINAMASAMAQSGEHAGGAGAGTNEVGIPRFW